MGRSHRSLPTYIMKKDAMSYKFHRLSQEKHIATIAFDHPELNITSDEVTYERCDIFESVLVDPNIRAIIITSAIPGHFGAGNDLQEELEETKSSYRQRTDRMLEIVRGFIESDKISIAAINGNAIGSTADLTLMCDIRVMGQPYYLRWPEAYLGLMPNWGASTLLPMLVGRSHALEWLLNGREIHTKELSEAGLLHGIHAPDDVLPAAQKLAEHVVQAHPASVRAIKSTVLHSFFMPLVYAFVADAKLSTQLFGEPESVARSRAFLNHRMTDYLTSKVE